jgi:hypothetical protein
MLIPLMLKDSHVVYVYSHLVHVVKFLMPPRSHQYSGNDVVYGLTNDILQGIHDVIASLEVDDWWESFLCLMCIWLMWRLFLDKKFKTKRGYHGWGSIPPWTKMLLCKIIEGGCWNKLKKVIRTNSKPTFVISQLRELYMVYYGHEFNFFSIRR